jgi:hypothetical protein
MAETLLELAALLLALFCLICSVRRRALYSPLPGGVAALKDRHTLYFLMLGSLTVSAAAAAAAGMLGKTGGISLSLSRVVCVFQLLFFLAFVLYALVLSLRRESAGGRRARSAVWPLLAAAAAGAAIQAFFDVRVALFFEAIALFGCLVLTEPETASVSPGFGSRSSAWTPAPSTGRATGRWPCWPPSTC